MNTYEPIFDDQAVAPTDNRLAPCRKLRSALGPKASGYGSILRFVIITTTWRPVPRFLPVPAGAVATPATASPCTRVSASSQSEEPMRKRLKQDQAPRIDKASVATPCYRA